MAIYALIKGGKVVNTIVADAAFIKANGERLAEQCIDVSDLYPFHPSPGCEHHGGKKFSAPPAAEPDPAPGK